MKIFLVLIIGFAFFTTVDTFSLNENVREKGRYGYCYKKLGFDSEGVNQPGNTWGFKNVEIYDNYIYFYDAAYPGQGNNYLILQKSNISRIVPNNIGNFTEIITTIPSGTDAFYRITLRSTGSHDSFIALMMQ